MYLYSYIQHDTLFQYLGLNWNLDAGRGGMESGLGTQLHRFTMFGAHWIEIKLGILFMKYQLSEFINLTINYILQSSDLSLSSLFLKERLVQS